MSWTEKAQEIRTETKQALQAVFDALNQGQQNKILKNEEVKALFDRYGVVTEKEDEEA